MKTKLIHKQALIIVRFDLRSFLCLLLTFTFFLQTISAQNNPASLKGESNRVNLVPNTTVNAGEIKLKSDSDNDGMTDEDEVRNGTNPDDPSDADGDLDGDGLTNGDEVAKGTNPNVTDSDGDGVSDNEEIRLGYNPLDPNNTPPPNTAIVSLQVSPNPIGLIVNTVFGATPVQLNVTGITNTGTSVNLTNNANTVYQSLDQSIAVVGTNGSVFGLASGSTTISVQNAALTANAVVNVATFTPGAVSSLEIPGYANNVDVAGNYAFVAAGIAGLQIVDVTNRNIPGIVASIDTFGNANDVRIVGNYAYVADGISGLQIINISNPLNPVLTSNFNTPGEANDVVIVGTLAYVADGLAGLQIIDISNPTTPQLIGSIDTPGKTRGVDVSGNYAVLAEGSPSIAVRVVDITDPASPQIIGNLTQQQEVIDVSVRGNFAYIAEWFGGLKIVDFSNPSSPVVVSEDFNFRPRDVTIQGDFLMVAETLQINFVPFFNIGVPSSLNYRGGIDLSNFGSANGTGIATDAEFVYLTGGFVSSFDKGVNSGFSKLFISRYQVPASDNNGIAPTVSLTSPIVGQNAKEGKALNITANAADDIYVTSVQFKVNGNIVAIDSASPYEFLYQVPVDAIPFAVTATALDLGGNFATSPSISVNITPDLLPTINLTNPVEDAVLVEGEDIILQAGVTDDEGIIQVSFFVDGVEIATPFTSPFETYWTVPTNITSLVIEATATDTVGRTTSVLRTFSVIPDPKTTVVGRVLTTDGQPVSGADITIFDTFTAQTASDGTFSIANVPTLKGVVYAKAFALLNNIAATNASLPAVPVRSGTTNIGDIKLSVGMTSPTVVSTGLFGSRDDFIFYGQDLFVGYNDRLSSVYSFNGTGFIKRTVGQMETGSVTAGISSSVSLVNSPNNQTFVQLSEQAGTINKFDADIPDNIRRRNVSTGLIGESGFIGIGRDDATGAEVLAFLSKDSTIIQLKVGNETVVTVPLSAGSTLHSLTLSDIDSNGFTDILALKHHADGSSKLVSIKRSSSNPPAPLVDSGIFEVAVESDIIERIGNPSNGLNNLFVGNFAENIGTEIAVLGNDRVRIYNLGLSGTAIFVQELLLPSGEVPTGIYGYSMNNSNLLDLFITTKNSLVTESRSLFVYLNSEIVNSFSNNNLVSKKNNKGLGEIINNTDFSNAPVVRTYTISNSNGDSRIIVGEWGGDSRLDVVVVEGDEIEIFFDMSRVIID
jgi:hypothetical protein